MRRKDREVTDITKIQDIIERSYCCRIGFNDNGQVYIVPLNYMRLLTIPLFSIFTVHAKVGKST